MSELASGEKKVEHLEQWRRFQGGYPVGRGAGQLKKTKNNYVASPSIKKENLHFFPTPIESHIGFLGVIIFTDFSEFSDAPASLALMIVCDSLTH